MEVREKSKSFTDLIVWKEAHEFVLQIYNLTNTFPKHEVYGLTSQLRRSAVSIAANIAEGYKKRTKPDKIRYMNIAQGSLEETRYYIILANDLQYLSSNNLLNTLENVSRLLNRYIFALTK